MNNAAHSLRMRDRAFSICLIGFLALNIVEGLLLVTLLDEDLIEECDRRPVRETDEIRRRYYNLTCFGGSVLTARIGPLEDLVKAAPAKRRTLNAEPSR